MSNAIQASLQKLNNAVQNLESAVVSIDARKAAKPAKASVGAGQEDLFSAGGSGKAAGNANNLNVRQLAGRLDAAINQVEKILKEGRG